MRTLSEEDATRRWAELVAEMAKLPIVCARLKAQHQADARGRCDVCAKRQRAEPGPLWPCRLYCLAEAASRHERRRAAIGGLRTNPDHAQHAADGQQIGVGLDEPDVDEVFPPDMRAFFATTG